MNVAAETERLLALFRAAGALQVDPGVLLPADVMLDLYGEDIRGRAYLTHDPVLGELMLRPDFTVPVVQMHMEHGADEIAERLAVLAEDAAAAPLAVEEVAFLERVLGVNGASSAALAELRGLGGLSEALDRFEARLEALAKRGIGDVPFDASYGRAAMEYYDGFVFEFSKGDVSAAQGGRYDAMTKVLGGGKGIPAIGAIVRPEALL